MLLVGRSHVKRAIESLRATALFLLVAAAAGVLSLDVARAAVASELLAASVAKQTDTTLGGLVRSQRSSFAAAVFVQDGQTSLARAYGVEDPASRLPFSIDSTLVDLNSEIKIFTATAVAQLIDRGMIASIDDPINRYLKHYQLPLAFGHEVTIREVATHSAGFDATDFGAGSLAADPARFFERRFPGYFKNAGLFSTYDSYGPKLLAYMVTELTGVSFPRYVQDAILGPLGMTHTYLAAPAIPPAHRVLAFQPTAPLNTNPSGDLTSEAAAVVAGVPISTMSDMAKLIRALLGPAADQRSVTPTMRDLMFRILQSNGARGSAHGLLFDAVRSGPTTLFVHGGVGPGIRCEMALDVTRHAGIFYCYGNVARRSPLDPGLEPPAFEDVAAAMLKPLVACVAGPTVSCVRYPPTVWRQDWDHYLGVYVATARHHRGFSRLRSLMHPTQVRIRRAGQALELDNRPGFVEIAPGTFGNPKYLETLSFVADPTTGRTMLSISDRPSVYEQPQLLDNPRLMSALLVLLALIAASGAPFILSATYGFSRPARLIVGAYAAIVGCGIFTLFGFHAFGSRYFNGISWPLNVVRCCAFLTIPAAVALSVSAVLARATIRRSTMERLARVHLDLLAVSAVLLVVTLLSVDLIGFYPIT